MSEAPDRRGTSRRAHRADRPVDGLPVGVVVVLQGVLIIVLLTGAGALAGLVWSHLWDAPSGVVRSGQWFTDETGLRASFSGTGLYLVIALITGLLCGVICGLLLARWELVTLVVLVAAALGAGQVMLAIGVSQSPPDPQVLAADAADGTRLPGQLRIAGVVPVVGMPLGVLLGYAVLLISVPKRGCVSSEESRETGPEPQEQSADHTFYRGSPG